MGDAFAMEVVKRLKSLMKDSRDVVDAQLVSWSLLEQCVEVT